ncbi:STAS domain-containing protein [Actinokineospora guangxiensis]|uniref:Anti-sigma factor antagonist n=1 Tax=Actinokineospora guangxiensis TaxID=1490288 RepID=A0ABW0ENP0_9PSEU
MELRMDDPPAQGVVQVAVGGEIDLVAAGVLERFLLGAVADRRAVEPGLVVDLSDTEFIGCAGVNALLSTQQRLHRMGGWLLLADVSRAVSRVLDVTGMNTALTVGSVTDLEMSDDLVD